MSIRKKSVMSMLVPRIVNMNELNEIFLPGAGVPIATTNDQSVSPMLPAAKRCSLSSETIVPGLPVSGSYRERHR